MTTAKAIKLSRDGTEVPFRMHPRVFQALGSELVTSDVVAVIELVKNCYDAFATTVDVRFGNDSDGRFLDIEDNGEGMSKDIIDNAWCVVATPYRETHKTATRGGKRRRTTGAKGLGRLSAARLGRTMQLITRSEPRQTWEVEVDWSTIASAKSIEHCRVVRRPYTGDLLSSRTGTLIRIRGLKSRWSLDEQTELQEALSRLISPFEELVDFAIVLTPPGEAAKPVKIETSAFLKHPTYRIKGTFDAKGTLSYRYAFKPFEGKPRVEPKVFEWSVVQTDLRNGSGEGESGTVRGKPLCGPFSFEIRVWDLDKESLLQTELKFDVRRTLVRRAIRAFKGISLYRDGVLVLPKSETNRDWLGLDLRRVSKVGTRLSTSQVVGYVAITADDNPQIEDTSDRERLAQTDGVAEFERVLSLIVSHLETERAQDQEADEPPLRTLFNDLSPQGLIDEAKEIVAEEGTASDVLPALERFSNRAEKARQQIEKQFVYYSRLATIGTISQMLIHEVANNCSAIDSFVGAVREALATDKFKPEILNRRLALAEQAVQALQALAEKFKPLAGRSFQRGRRVASVSDVVDACVAGLAEQIKQAKIEVKLQLRGRDSVRFDPGELFPAMYNIVDNAVYWVQHAKGSDRTIEIRTSDSGKYVVCEISDSGPGVAEEDRERIFLAGVTRKPNGSGMGLTVAGELLESNDGMLSLKNNSRLKGATFRLMLPAA